MNKIAIITASLGEFNREPKWIEQSIKSDFYSFNDKNFPPRINAMSPRLQARIVKMFYWQLVPNYEYYIWFDNSLEIANDKMVEWFIEKLGDYDAVFLRHPDRKTIKEEWEFIKTAVDKNNYYLAPRYKNELGDEELEEIYSDKEYNDNLLIASTAFMIRNNEKTQTLMKEWWYHTSRYHIVDQLGLPYAIYKSKSKVNIIDENYINLPNFNRALKRHK